MESHERIEKDRQRLLAISDADAENLSTPDKYQRMRYQREIEAANWLAEIRKGLPVLPAKKSGAVKYLKDYRKDGK